MATKRGNKETKNSRRWTETEINLFADVLAEPENNFAFTLEKLALKKSSNNELFEYIQREVSTKMEEEDFKIRNSDNLKGRESKLDVNIEKLRQKYKWLKNEWSSKTTRAKNGSGLEPDKEPHWYKVINPVFSETHRPLNLVSSAMDTSFVAQDSADSSEDHDEDEVERDNRLVNLDIEDEENSENQIEGSPENRDNLPTRKKSKLVAAPHKKCRQIRSNKHGLSEIARAMNASVAMQEKRFQRQFKASEEREKRMIEFRALEAEKDRQHELRMAQLFMSQRHSSPPSPLGVSQQQQQQHQSFSRGWGMNATFTGRTMNETNTLISPSRANHDPYQPVTPSLNDEY